MPRIMELAWLDNFARFADEASEADAKFFERLAEEDAGGRNGYRSQGGPQGRGDMG